MDVLQGRKGAVSPVSGVLSSQSRVLLACSLGFFPQTRDLGSLGTEGHPRGSRGGAGADLAGSPVPGGGTWVPGSGLGLSLQGCAEWSGAPHPQPQAQPCLQLPNQRQRGGRPLTLPPGPTLTLHPATLPSPARCPRVAWPLAPVPLLPLHPPILSPGVACSAGLRLSPPADAGCGLCCLASTWLAGGSGVSRPPWGGPSLPTRCWVAQVTQELGPSACLPRIVHLAAASSLGTPWGPAGQGLQKTLDGVPVLQAVSLCL